MGIRATWIAVRGVDEADVFERLGFIDTGEAADDDGLELSYTQAPGGWLIIFCPEREAPPAEKVEALSVGGQAIICTVSETVMYSEARGYENGRALWSIEHDGGEQGCDHLDVAGAPPPEFGPIRDRLTARQAEEDAGEAMTDYVFDIPAELTYALCGYRGDGQAMPGGSPEMTLLRNVDARRPAARERGGGLLKALGGLFRRR
jgi:hypothetical protein